MTKEQALFLRDFLLQRVEAVHLVAMRALGSIPEAQGDYRPRPCSRSAREMAAHIVGTELMVLTGIAHGQFSRADDAGNRLSLMTIADLAAHYDERFNAAVEQVRRLSVKQLTTYLSLCGVFRQPAVVFLTFLHDHTLHHCGQLNAYLHEFGLASSAATTAAPTMKYVWSERRRPSEQWPKLLTSGDTTTCS